MYVQIKINLENVLVVFSKRALRQADLLLTELTRQDVERFLRIFYGFLRLYIVSLNLPHGEMA